MIPAPSLACSLCVVQAYADTDAAAGMWMGARLQLAAVEEAISDQPGPLLESLLEEVREKGRAGRQDAPGGL